MPPPAPWTTRKSTSSVMFWATPQSAEPTREDDDGGQEDPLAAEAVSQPSRRRDEDGQAHQIGDHDAVDGGGGDVEVAADGGERDVHDRDVHDVHEHRRHEHDADGDLLIHADDGHDSLPVLRSAGEAVRRRVDDRAARLRPSTLCAGSSAPGPPEPGPDRRRSVASYGSAAIGAAPHALGTAVPGRLVVAGV